MFHIQVQIIFETYLLSKIDKPPSYDFESFDNSVHRLWCISDLVFIEELKSLLNNVNAFYIADGHHRMGAMEYM